jgi:hypothetical protein
LGSRDLACSSLRRLTTWVVKRRNELQAKSREPKPKRSDDAEGEGDRGQKRKRSIGALPLLTSVSLTLSIIRALGLGFAGLSLQLITALNNLGILNGKLNNEALLLVPVFGILGRRLSPANPSPSARMMLRVRETEVRRGSAPILVVGKL